MFCPIKVNSNTIELAVHTSCCCILDLLCATSINISFEINLFFVQDSESKTKDLPKEPEKVLEKVPNKVPDKVPETVTQKKVNQKEEWEFAVDKMLEENPEYKPLVQAVIDEVINILRCNCVGYYVA